MQKKVVVPLLIAISMSLGLSATADTFKIPCLEELRAIQALMLDTKWPEVKYQLSQVLLNCPDSQAIEAASELAENLPPGTHFDTSHSLNSMFTQIEVGLQFTSTMSKSSTHWYFRTPPTLNGAKAQRLLLTYEKLQHVLIDTEIEGPNCPVPATNSDWTCITSKDTSKIPPLPGLYRLEVHTSKGTVSQRFTLSRSRLQFDLLYLYSPGSAYQVYQSPQIPYSVSNPDPVNNAKITDYQFVLFRQGITDALRKWHFPAEEFKSRGFINTPTPGNYRLQFITRQTKKMDQLTFVLESITDRDLRVSY